MSDTIQDFVADIASDVGEAAEPVDRFGKISSAELSADVAKFLAAGGKIQKAEYVPPRPTTYPPEEDFRRTAEEVNPAIYGPAHMCGTEEGDIDLRDMALDSYLLSRARDAFRSGAATPHQIARVERWIDRRLAGCQSRDHRNSYGKDGTSPELPAIPCSVMEYSEWRATN